MGGGVVKLHVGFPTIVNSASHSNLYFDWSIAKEAIRKLSGTCQKVVTNTNAQHCSNYYITVKALLSRPLSNKLPFCGQIL